MTGLIGAQAWAPEDGRTLCLARTRRTYEPDTQRPERVQSRHREGRVAPVFEPPSHALVTVSADVVFPHNGQPFDPGWWSSDPSLVERRCKPRGHEGRLGFQGVPNFHHHKIAVRAAGANVMMQPRWPVSLAGNWINTQVPVDLILLIGGDAVELQEKGLGHVSLLFS